MEYGRDELLRRLAHPFWFQSFGAVMGMDWHSSGITTSVLGALKRGLAPRACSLGLHVCGGRGRHSRKTPDELRLVGERTGLDGVQLARASRLVAKVDSAAVQDGFDLYLHGFIVADNGQWTVVQQGMNTTRREARRYHWCSDGLTSFVDAPHAAIEGQATGVITNLVDSRAAASRASQLELLRDHTPSQLVTLSLEARRAADPRAAPQSEQLELPHLVMPAHPEVRPANVEGRRLQGALTAAVERGPADFPELLLTPGVGARTIFSLAMVAEVVHGAAHRFSDPARFAMAHGGKDGTPFPVPIHVYDQTIRTLTRAITAARLGQREKLEAIKRLDSEARRLEQVAAATDVAAFMAAEVANSAAYGGRTVDGWVARETIASAAHGLRPA